MVTGKINTNSSWRWSTEVQSRIGDNASYPERLLLQPSISYAVKPNITIWLGYDRNRVHMDNQKIRLELGYLLEASDRVNNPDAN